MKIAILSESDADEAGLRVLVDGILGQSTEPLPLSLRTRGWPSVRDVLPAVFKHLWYHTNAEGLLVVVDSDRSPVHAAAHDATADPACRLCELRRVVGLCRSPVRPRPIDSPLPVAIGLAVPSIESWWLCGEGPHYTEQAWARELNSGRPPFTVTELKRTLYGTDRCPLKLMRDRMIDAARRVSGDLPRLERAFPDGFGALLRELRTWIQQT